MKYYDLVLVETPLDGGFDRRTINWLLDMLKPDIKVIPVEFQSEYSVAIGFITTEAADIINYKYLPDSKLHEFICSILDNKGTDSVVTKFDAITIYMD